MKNITNKSSQKIIHILTESEPFSQHSGGAISRWVGNVINHTSPGIESLVMSYLAPLWINRRLARKGVK